MKKKTLFWILTVSLVANALLIIAFDSRSADLDRKIIKIEKLQAENIRLLEKESINEILINAGLAAAAEIEEEYQGVVEVWKDKYTAAEKEKNYYKSLPVFEDLKSCQVEFDSVVIDFEKYIDESKKEFSLAIELHLEETRLLKQSIDLLSENWENASSRATNNKEQRDIYKDIAESRLKKWGWFAGVGGYLGYDLKGEMKAGFAITVSWGRRLGGNKKYKKALRVLETYKEVNNRSKLIFD